jgi:hypothetical protein
MLYLIEEADAHFRNENLGPALKRYIAVQKVSRLPLGPSSVFYA